MGYQTPDDLRTSFPNFFRRVVYPLIQPALLYLQATQQGRQIVQELFNNVAIAEQPRSQQTAYSSTSNPVFCQQRYHYYLQDDSDTLAASPLPTSALVNQPPLSYFCLNSGMPNQEPRRKRTGYRSRFAPEPQIRIASPRASPQSSGEYVPYSIQG